MWFRGRFSGAATVLVLEPSQVTGLAEEAAGVFDVGVCAAVPEPLVEVLAPEEPAESEDFEEEPEPAFEEPVSESGFVFLEGCTVVEAPSSLTPVPSLQAPRESVARTAVAAAPARRMREVRRFDMWLCPSCSGGW
jgi:hypothetical protein